MYFGSEDLRELHPHLISKQLLSTYFCQPILPRESLRENIQGAAKQYLNKLLKRQAVISELEGTFQKAQ